jgi:hypothetical protein
MDLPLRGYLPTINHITGMNGEKYRWLYVALPNHEGIYHHAWAIHEWMHTCYRAAMFYWHTDNSPVLLFAFSRTSNHPWPNSKWWTKTCLIISRVLYQLSQSKIQGVPITRAQHDQSSNQLGLLEKFTTELRFKKLHILLKYKTKNIFLIKYL